MELYCVNQTIPSVDEAQALMLERRAAGSIELMQDGPFDMTITHGSVPSVHFWIAQSPASFRLRYAVEAEQYLIHFPGEGRIEAVTRRSAYSIDDETGAILPMGEVDHLRYEAHRAGLAMSVSRRGLVRRLSARLGYPVANEIVFEPTFSRQSRGVRQMVEFVAKLLDPSVAWVFSQSRDISQSISHVLKDMTLDLLPSNYSDILRQLQTLEPPAFVKRALSFIAARDDIADLAPVDVAEAVGVSLRSLQYAFQEHLRCTPSAYIKRERLRRAHAALCAGGRVRITAVARRAGFANVGRFTRDFEAQFGEPPAAVHARAVQKA